MNIEEVPTTFEKKEISLYRKSIPMAILPRGGMSRTNEIFPLISDRMSFYDFSKEPSILIKTLRTTSNFCLSWVVESTFIS